MAFTSKGVTETSQNLAWTCLHCIWNECVHRSTDSQAILNLLGAVQIAKWEAADACFNLDADLFSNTLKLRQAGYEGARLDTKTNFYERFEEMADRFKHICSLFTSTFSCYGRHASCAAAD